MGSFAYNNETINSFLFPPFFAADLASAGLIQELLVKTGTIDSAGCDCDLTFVILTPNGSCVTPSLDGPGDDFESGHVDSYTGAQLGECNEFDAGTKLTEWEMVIIHSGSDGWAGEYVEVKLDDGTLVQCNLDNQVVDDFQSRHVYC